MIKHYRDQVERLNKAEFYLRCAEKVLREARDAETVTVENDRSYEDYRYDVQRLAESLESYRAAVQVLTEVL